MAKLSATDKAALQAFRRWEQHSWYLDPCVVPFVLANDKDMLMEEKEMEAIARKLYTMDNPVEYDMLRRNNSGFLPDLDELASFDEPPSLAEFLSEESLLIFSILKQGKLECKWMLLPMTAWHFDPDYKKFQNFVKKLSVVNDSSERAVKLV